MFLFAKEQEKLEISRQSPAFGISYSSLKTSYRLLEELGMVPIKAIIVTKPAQHPLCSSS